MQGTTMQRTAFWQAAFWRQAIRRPPAVAVWLGALGLMAFSASADDRNLLRLSQSGSVDPYVFIMFDTSASMTWTPVCSQADTFDDVDPFDSMCTQDCSLDPAVCAQVCPYQSCRDFVIIDPENPVDIPADPAGGNDFWLDNTDADFVPSPLVSSGYDGWVATSAASDHKGSNYYFTRGIGLRTVTYNPDIPSDGTYMVFASWPTSSSRGSNIMIDVTHQDGTDTVTSTVAVDQAQGVATGDGTEYNGWNLIGTYELNTTDSNSGTVTIRTESSNGTVVADAVRWLKIDVTCFDDNDLVYRCQQPMCPGGDCYTPLNGDDPNSKFFQAKEAVFDAIESFDSVHFGFGSYQQTNPRLHMKHWLYRVREVDPTTGFDQALPDLGGAPFLEVGDEEVFGNYSTEDSFNPGSGAGDGWNCDDGSGDFRVGCNLRDPADLTDVWEVARAHRIPKLGYDGSLTTAIWYRKDYDDDQLWRVRYYDAGYELGDDPFGAILDLSLCQLSPLSCGAPVPANVYYDLVSDYSAVDGELSRQPMQTAGFFDVEKNVEAFAGRSDPAENCETPSDSNPNPDRSGCDTSSCGLEPNDDSDLGGNDATEDTFDDIWFDYNVKWPTILDPQGEDWDFDGNLDGMPDSPRVTVFDVGDMIPLDWDDVNVDEIQRRLAPNSVQGGVPDFRIATYFKDTLDAGDPTGAQERRLRLLNDDSDSDVSDDERPLLPIGLTPLGEALVDFKDWYAGTGNDPDDVSQKGWADFAVLADPNFACRQKIVLLLTDGLDSCYQKCKDPLDFPRCPGDDYPCASPTCDGEAFSNDPCTAPGTLLSQEQIKTWVVGFGLQSGSSLNCMAENGGTEAPLLPRNKGELVAALESILEDVQAEQRAFASASIPALQSTAADKIFLSSFTPVPYDPLAAEPDEPAPGFWPGRIDAFRKPLPLTADNRPDVDRVCEPLDVASNLQSACHVWEAGQVLCDQEINDERTVLYGFEDTEGDDVPGGARPGPLSAFEVPQYLIEDPTGTYDPLHADFSQLEDLAKVLFLESPDWIRDKLPWFRYQLGIWNNEAIYNRLSDIVDKVGLKDLPFDLVDGDADEEDPVEACDRDGDGNTDSFVLGDVFHASPVAISGPSNFTYFANDLCGPVQRTDKPDNCIPPNSLFVNENRGYRQFAADHVWRRRMLAAATNDGQIHFFDAGVRQLVDNDFTPAANDKIELFNDGSGKELFSYVPRMILPVLREQALGERHIYSMDGSLTVGDVFIDPVDPLGGSAVLEDRNWRTVLIAGMREAGDVYPSTADVAGFKSGYVALDITQPDVLKARPDGSTDPTLIPCEQSDGTGCSETAVTSKDYPPSCLGISCLHPVMGDTDLSKEPVEATEFPAELWTFRDSWLIEIPAASDNFVEYFLDEDSDGDSDSDPADDENGYGVPDLAGTWSRPVIGQVAICPTVDAATCGPGGSGLITKHVAIFGGGMDPDSKTLADASDLQGHYLYMVDVETGLTIYKKKLCPARDSMTGECTADGAGAAPGDPAVLDRNQDGIFDVVYIGTTDGYLYKVNLQTLTAAAKVPGLASFDIYNRRLIRDTNYDGDYDETYEDVAGSGTEITTQRVIDKAWNPFRILDTGTTDNMGDRTPSPIYFPPSLFFVPERDQFALAVGTGDREDLWSSPANGGTDAKYFVIVDEDFTGEDSSAACVDKVPITEKCVVSYPFTASTFDDPKLNFLTEPLESGATVPSGVDAVTEDMRPGWSMRFPTSDPLQNRVTTETFAISGILIFSVFDPNVVTVAAPGDDDDVLECGRSGTTRAFVVLARNGGPVTALSGLPAADGGPRDQLEELTEEDRFHEVAEFTTAPFIERTATKNDPTPTGRTLSDLLESEVNRSLQEAILEQLPRGSRFNDAYKVVIAALRNSTGVNVYAEIPIAMYPADWRDQ